MTLSKLTTTAAAFVMLAGGAALAQAQTDSPAMPATVVDVVAGSDDHTTLETAVIEAGLAETLSGEGPYTVFAPTDAAFGALPAGALEAALAEEDKATLKSILGCHVLTNKALAADVTGMIEAGNGTATVTTLGNCRLNLTAVDGEVRINDVVSVTTADLEAGNGVVHVINGVLTPAAPAEAPADAAETGEPATDVTAAPTN